MLFYRHGRSHYYWKRANSTFHINVDASIINNLDFDYIAFRTGLEPDWEYTIIDKEEFLAAFDLVAFNMQIEIKVII